MESIRDTIVAKSHSEKKRIVNEYRAKSKFFFPMKACVTSVYNTYMAKKAALPVYVPEKPSKSQLAKLGYTGDYKSYRYKGKDIWRTRACFRKSVLLDILVMKVASSGLGALWCDGVQTDFHYILITIGIVDNKFYQLIKSNVRIPRDFTSLLSDRSSKTLFNRIDSIERAIYDKLLSYFSVKRAMKKVELNIDELKSYIVDLCKAGMKSNSINNDEKELIKAWGKYADELSDLKNIQTVSDFFTQAYIAWKNRIGELDTTIVKAFEPLEQLPPTDVTKLGTDALDIMQGKTNITTADTNVRKVNILPDYDQTRETNYMLSSQNLSGFTPAEQIIIKKAMKASNSKKLKKDTVRDMLDGLWNYNAKAQSLVPQSEFKDRLPIVNIQYTECPDEFFEILDDDNVSEKEPGVISDPVNLIHEEALDIKISRAQKTGKVEKQLAPSEAMKLSSSERSKLDSIISSVKTDIMDSLFGELLSKMNTYHIENSLVVPPIESINAMMMEPILKKVTSTLKSQKQTILLKKLAAIRSRLYTWFMNEIRKGPQYYSVLRRVVKLLKSLVSYLKLYSEADEFCTQIMDLVTLRLQKAFCILNRRTDSSLVDFEKQYTDAFSTRLTINGTSGNNYGVENDDAFVKDLIDHDNVMQEEILDDDDNDDDQMSHISLDLEAIDLAGVKRLSEPDINVYIKKKMIPFEYVFELLSTIYCGKLSDTLEIIINENTRTSTWFARYIKYIAMIDIVDIFIVEKIKEMLMTPISYTYTLLLWAEFHRINWIFFATLESNNLFIEPERDQANVDSAVLKLKEKLPYVKALGGVAPITDAKIPFDINTKTIDEIKSYFSVTNREPIENFISVINNTTKLAINSNKQPQQKYIEYLEALLDQLPVKFDILNEHKVFERYAFIDNERKTLSSRTPTTQLTGGGSVVDVWSAFANRNNCYSTLINACISNRLNYNSPEKPIFEGVQDSNLTGNTGGNPTVSSFMQKDTDAKTSQPATKDAQLDSGMNMEPIKSPAKDKTASGDKTARLVASLRSAVSRK